MRLTQEFWLKIQNKQFRNIVISNETQLLSSEGHLKRNYGYKS